MFVVPDPDPLLDFSREFLDLLLGQIAVGRRFLGKFPIGLDRCGQVLLPFLCPGQAEEGPRTIGIGRPQELEDLREGLARLLVPSGLERSFPLLEQAGNRSFQLLSCCRGHGLVSHHRLGLRGAGGYRHGCPTCFDSGPLGSPLLGREASWRRCLSSAGSEGFRSRWAGGGGVSRSLRWGGLARP